MIPPIKFGIKKMVLYTFVPFFPFDKQEARKKAMTLTVIMDIAIIFAVNHSEFINPSSIKTL
jgi:hypothetical protein